MQNTPVTIAERFAAIGGAAIFAFVIFGVATLLHHAISRNDDRKRTQGRPIRWWVTGLYLVGAIAGVMLADNKQYYMHEVVGGLGGFGILAGLLIGNVHGGINLVLTPDPDRNRGPDGDTNPFSPRVLIPRNHDDGNPYAPPTHQ
ncbi:hypothetical protein [Rhodopirellula europaea]|uniref:Membrane protein n=1 Tax=Rhodopirellula europaea 6C TaxID=1263867 RepID=M2AW68_9BACT|nr:hypothetical protein [Rhodopirellula europaea]EMB14244.1 membrane protein [Rhodopirellula europaea 6C]